MACQSVTSSRVVAAWFSSSVICALEILTRGDALVDWRFGIPVAELLGHRVDLSLRGIANIPLRLQLSVRLHQKELLQLDALHHEREIRLLGLSLEERCDVGKRLADACELRMVTS